MKYVRFQKPLTIALTSEIYAEVHEMSEDQQVSMAEVIRKILSRFIKNRKKTVKNEASSWLREDVQILPFTEKKPFRM